jgi:ADP-ribose pyrophosphatase YjhB (NUDIX family)
MATDIIIEYPDKDHIVLIERKHPPYGLALPGGMMERITFAQNAVKEAKEETGLEVRLRDVEPRLYMADDPREFIATTVFVGTGYGTLRPDPDEDAASAAVYSRSQVRELIEKDRFAFKHHGQMLNDYLEER